MYQDRKSWIRCLTSCALQSNLLELLPTLAPPAHVGAIGLALEPLAWQITQPGGKVSLQSLPPCLSSPTSPCPLLAQFLDENIHLG